MGTRDADVVRQHIQQLVRKHNDAQATDRELLERFAIQKDEAAFEVLFRRHGAMILAVGNRVLGDAHAAEDVCQATFLVLAKRASSQRWQASVASWLYKTAHLLALKTRTATLRRARREGRIAPRSPANPLAEITGQELLAALDEELLALPEGLRAPLVLCYLEGATRDEAAQRLACPLATLKNRLERGRRRLHLALLRRGLGLSAVLLGTLSTQHTADAAIMVLARSTAPAALALAAGKSLDGVISSQVSQLLHGGLGIMAWSKLKAAMAMLMVGLLSMAGALAYSARNDQQVRTEDRQTAAPAIKNVAAAGTILRYQFKEGDTFSYVVEKKTETHCTAPGITRDVSTTETYDVTWRVVGSDPDGNAKMTLTIDRIRYLNDEGFPGALFEFDSKKRRSSTGVPSLSRILSPFLKAQVKAEFVCTVSPRGEVSDFKIPKKVADAAPRAKQMRFAEDIQADLASQGSVLLPKQSALKGDNWEEKTGVYLAGAHARMIVYTKATYQGSSDRGGKQLEEITLKPVAKAIESLATSRLAPFALKKHEGKGNVLFDNHAGRLVESAMTQDVEMESGPPGQTVAWKIRLSLSSRLASAK